MHATEWKCTHLHSFRIFKPHVQTSQTLTSYICSKSFTQNHIIFNLSGPEASIALYKATIQSTHSNSSKFPIFQDLLIHHSNSNLQEEIPVSIQNCLFKHLYFCCHCTLHVYTGYIIPPFNVKNSFFSVLCSAILCALSFDFICTLHLVTLHSFL